jgi:uncharacterized cupredoxin-like copper-binding protein
MRRACLGPLLLLALVASAAFAALAAGAGARWASGDARSITPSARVNSATPSARANSTPPLAAVAASSHLQVIQIEYRLILSRGTVKAGAVSLEAIDRGADPHNMRLRAGAWGAEINTPELVPQQRWDGVVRLKPGIYELWCSLPEHAKLGMHATLRVVR